MGRPAGFWVGWVWGAGGLLLTRRRNQSRSHRTIHIRQGCGCGHTRSRPKVRSKLSSMRRVASPSCIAARRRARPSVPPPKKKKEAHAKHPPPDGTERKKRPFGRHMAERNAPFRTDGTLGWIRRAPSIFGPPSRNYYSARGCMRGCSPRFPRTKVGGNGRSNSNRDSNFQAPDRRFDSSVIWWLVPAFFFACYLHIPSIDSSDFGAWPPPAPPPAGSACIHDMCVDYHQTRTYLLAS